MRLGVFTGFVAVILIGVSSAQTPRTNVGMLTCTLAKSAQGQLGTMSCGFKSTGGGPEEKFSGWIRSAAPETGGKLVLIWAVFGPANAKVSGGALAQRYRRAEATAGQPPLWVGERNAEIVLQFETNDAAHAGGEIAEIELKLTGTAA
jgi:hypothetical protein